MKLTLNANSRTMIENIIIGFRQLPAYKAFEINSYCYDKELGVQALSVTKNGTIINLWLFYPGNNGEIESIAAYGSNLDGHLNAIRTTMTVFGLPVKTISREHGKEDFLDIFIAPYGTNVLTTNIQDFNRENFDSAVKNVIGEFSKYAPIMCDYKNYIQTKVRDIATYNELNDVKNSIFNQALFNKLIDVACKKWNDENNKNIELLYCASMSIGTIIKEYDWGMQYVMPDGLYEIAKLILSK